MEYPPRERRRFVGGFVYLTTHAVLGELVKHSKAPVLTRLVVGVALIGC